MGILGEGVEIGEGVLGRSLGVRRSVRFCRENGKEAFADPHHSHASRIAFLFGMYACVYTYIILILIFFITVLFYYQSLFCGILKQRLKINFQTN